MLTKCFTLEQNCFRSCVRKEIKREGTAMLIHRCGGGESKSIYFPESETSGRVHSGQEHTELSHGVGKWGGQEKEEGRKSVAATSRQKAQ